MRQFTTVNTNIDVDTIDVESIVQQAFQNNELSAEAFAKLYSIAQTPLTDREIRLIKLLRDAIATQQIHILESP